MGSGHFPPDLPRSALAWRGLCLTLVCTRTCCPTRWDRAGRETTGGTAREEICRPALATCVAGRGLRVQADAPGQPGRHARLWLVTAAGLEPATLSFEG